jgi:hypothetical protein
VTADSSWRTGAASKREELRFWLEGQDYGPGDHVAEAVTLLRRWLKQRGAESPELLRDLMAWRERDRETR